MFCFLFFYRKISHAQKAQNAYNRTKTKGNVFMRLRTSKRKKCCLFTYSLIRLFTFLVLFMFFVLFVLFVLFVCVKSFCKKKKKIKTVLMTSFTLLLLFELILLFWIRINCKGIQSQEICHFET